MNTEAAMPEPMIGRVTLNVRETARALGVHENTVRNWADNGLLTNVAALPFAPDDLTRTR